METKRGCHWFKHRWVEEQADIRVRQIIARAVAEEKKQKKLTQVA